MEANGRDEAKEGWTRRPNIFLLSGLSRERRRLLIRQRRQNGARDVMILNGLFLQTSISRHDVMTRHVECIIIYIFVNAMSG